MNIKCEKCGETTERTGKRQKYCPACRDDMARARSYQHAVRTRIKNPGVGSGGAQPTGEDHPTYKNGTGIYTRIAFDAHGYDCDMCGVDTRTLERAQVSVHHLNRDRADNRPENLQVLCKSCHAKTHDMAANFPKGIVHPPVKAGTR